MPTGIYKHTKGWKHTEEARRKMREAKKKNPTRYWLGKCLTEEHRKKLREAKKKWFQTHENFFKGKSFSKEHKQHLSEAHKGKKGFWLGKHRSKETIRKMSEALKGRKSPNKGKKFSIEYRKKLSESHKGQVAWNKGKKIWPIKENHPMFGKHHSEETKRKISKANKGKKNPRVAESNKLHLGEKSPNWRGGLSCEPYSVDWTQTLKRSIRERDNYICQLCNQYGNVVHHIDYNKKNCNPDNLITLCVSCNFKVNYRRKYWTKYFQHLIFRWH